MATLTAWTQSQMEVPWMAVTGKGAILCVKAQGDCPFPRTWDRGVQSKAGLGWTWADYGAQTVVACPPSVSPGPQPMPPQPPPWGSHRPLAGPREGLCGGLAAWPATVHRGPDGCTLEHGPPPWMKLCLTARLPGRTLKAHVNTEDGLTLRVTRLSVCICLAPGRQDQKAVPGLHSQGLA